MLVDAYNTESTIHYYIKNGFKPLYPKIRNYHPIHD